MILLKEQEDDPMDKSDIILDKLNSMEKLYITNS